MENNSIRRPFWRIPWWAACLAFLAIAVTLSWQEHKAHIMTALSWALFLACPLMHFFMHRGHDHGGSEAGHAHLHSDTKP